MAFMTDGYLCKIVWLQKNCIDSFLVHRPMQGKTSYAWAKQSLIFEKFQNTFSLIYSGLLYQFLESRSKSVQCKLCNSPGSKQQQHKGLQTLEITSFGGLWEPQNGYFPCKIKISLITITKIIYRPMLYVRKYKRK